jgi:predicted Fe-Mo cluster-binding NifX family protein
MPLIVACATDNGVDLIKRHFGDAEFYLIYKINESNYEFIKKIINTTEEEEGHADPKKAKGISQILKEEEVQVGLSCAFGPNIVRIKKNFVPVVAHAEKIEEALKKLVDNYNIVIKEWYRGKDRKHIILNNI